MGDRRRFLRALGATCLGALAGCSSDDGRGESPSPTGGESKSTPTSSPTPASNPTVTPTETPTATPTPKPSGPALSIARPRNVWGVGARLQGRIQRLGDRDSLEVWFRYRELNTDEWRTSERVTVSETGAFFARVTGLTRQRYYRLQLVATVDGETITSDERLFSTPSGSSPKPSEPWQSYPLGPTAGFAVMGQWLNNNTPHVVVRKPTRAQLETALQVDGPRVVVFETSGTIDLGGEDARIPHDRCWIAGQLSPSPGVTLVRGGLRIEANRCVVQHLRVRPGDEATAGEDAARNAVTIAEGVHDTVLDHCTFSWAVDDGIEIGPGTSATTVSNCIVAEGLRNGADGESGHAIHVGRGGGRVALLGNLLAFTNDRHPRLAGESGAVVANNLAHAYEDGTRVADGAVGSLVGNVYEAPETSAPAIDGSGEAYASDNVASGGVPMVGEGLTRASNRPLWPEGTEALPSDRTAERVLTNAGAWSGSRTANDRRVAENVRANRGGYVESQAAVGGYPSLPENEGTIEPQESMVRKWLYENAVAIENTTRVFEGPTPTSAT